MSLPSQNEITKLLNMLREGNQRVVDELLPIVYHELLNLGFRLSYEENEVGTP